MSHFIGKKVGIFWISLDRTDSGCWRLTLRRYSSLNLHTKKRTTKDTKRNICKCVGGRQRILKEIFVNVSVYQRCNSYTKSTTNGLIINKP